MSRLGRMRTVATKTARSSILGLPVFVGITVVFAAIMIGVELAQSGSFASWRELGLVVLAMASLVLPMYVTVIGGLHAAAEVEGGSFQ